MSKLPSLYAELKRKVRLAEFEGKTTRDLAGQIRVELRDQIDRNDLLQLKSVVLLSEIYDYYGMFEASGKISAPGKDILDLREPPHRGAREMIQAKIRLKTAYARCLYRAPEFTSVIEDLLACRSYVNEYLVSEEFPCCGTLGEIAYMLARAYRQRQRIAEALRECTEAIRLYQRRAVQKRRRDPHTAAEAEAFSAHKIAVIMALAVSWCNYVQGALSTAMYTNLVPAQAILRRSEDILNRAYADVIRASIVRELIGTVESDLNEATSGVRAALQVFKDYGHRHYAAGASLELAALALARKRTTEAANHLTDGEAILEHRWKTNALIIKSQISLAEENQYEALRAARDACKQAIEFGEPLGQIDALLTRAECYGPGEGGNAIEDLKRALHLNGSDRGEIWGLNPRVHGLIHVRLTRHYLNQGRVHDALTSFAQWQKVRDRIEHRQIHQLAESVSRELDQLGRIEFRFEDGLDYRANNRRLREFLLRQAQAHNSTQDQMSRALGIGRASLNKWLHEFQPQKHAAGH